MGKAKKVIYLASNLGFSKSQKELILPKAVESLSGLGYDVIEPFSDNNQEAAVIPMPLKTAHRIALKDMLDVIRSDAILLFLNGEPPDTGVYAEGGMAAALRKKTFVLRDDFRLCTDCLEFPVNLMALAGMPAAKGLSGHFYKSIEELSDPQKALARFARGGDVHPLKSAALDSMAEKYKSLLAQKIREELSAL